MKNVHNFKDITAINNRANRSLAVYILIWSVGNLILYLPKTFDVLGFEFKLYCQELLLFNTNYIYS